MAKPIIAETQARRLLKNRTATLSVRRDDIPGEPLVIERIVPGGYEVFFENYNPPRKAGVFHWHEFEVVAVNLITYEEGMTAEEAQERLDLLQSMEPPKH